MMKNKNHQYGEKTVQDFINLYNNSQLNLSPGFQRDSVWSDKDRKKLIESIIQNYPLPAVFLYRRDDHGKPVYDVIDGKQRLESIFSFLGLKGFQKRRFSVTTDLFGNGVEELDWIKLQKKVPSSSLLFYGIPVVEVWGDFSEIVHLFVLINSTGKKLTPQEIRKAKFYQTDFLIRAGHLAERYQKYFIQNRILSNGQIKRMKHVELTCELLASFQTGGLLNKKKTIDGILEGEKLKGKLLQQAAQDFARVLNRLVKIFPDLRSTRFANSVDFYSLCLFVWELEKQGCILTDANRNRQAEKLLIWLSDGVDKVRQQVRKAEGAKLEQKVFADYLLTIQGDTDSLATRQRRAAILQQILGNLFERKDSQRHFTPEQRRLIWNSAEQKRCQTCLEPLTWDNFTIDHIKSHATGGRTSANNAALLCKRHNSSKGAK